jgi:hypothetical protein
MKKLILPLMVLSIGIISCGGKKKEKSAEDIVVADLKTACDCVDGMSLVAGETLLLIDKFPTEEEMKKDQEASTKFEKLEAKLKEIDNRCGKELNIKKEEAQKCTGWDGLNSTMEKIEAKL